MNSRRQMRHCSFCGDDSHTIVTCDSEALPDFEFICVRKVLTIETTDAFKEWLSHDYSHDIFLLRAFAMRKYRMDAERQIPRITSRSSFAECADVITNYIFTTYNGEVGLDQTIEPVNETIYHEDFVDREFAELMNEPIRPLTLEDLAMTPDADLSVPAAVFQDEPVILYDLRMLDSILSQIGVLMQRDPSILGAAILVDLRLRITEILNAVDVQTPVINSRVETNEHEQLDNTCSCSICWDEKELINFVRLDCKHEFCKDCIIATTTHNNGRVPCCALCRGEVRTIISRTDGIKTEIARVIR
jgi:hypothetical protein